MMEQDYIYKVVYIVLFLIYLLVRIIYAKDCNGNINRRKKGEKREKILVFLASIGMMPVPLIWVFSDLFEKMDISLPLSLRMIGIITAMLSLWLFREVHKALGKNWSPVLEIREGHTLIKDGPYKRIRHPMYTQTWIWAIAQFLITANWAVGLLGFISWSLLYFIRVPQEEKMMKEEFGEAYLEYIEQTGRIFPKFSKWSS